MEKFLTFGEITGNRLALRDEKRRMTTDEIASICHRGPELLQLCKFFTISRFLERI